MESELLPIEVLHCGNRDFRPFCSCDLDLDPMSFIYELDRYFLKIYRVYENELPMSRLSEVIVWHTYIHTDRQTDRQDRPTTLKLYTCFAGSKIKKCFSHTHTHTHTHTHIEFCCSHIRRIPRFPNYARIAPLVWNENRDKTWRWVLVALHFTICSNHGVRGNASSLCHHIALSLSDILVTRRFALVLWVQSLQQNVTSVTCSLDESAQCKVYQCLQYDIALLQWYGLHITSAESVLQ